MYVRSGLFGIRPQVDAATGKPDGLLVNPLLEPSMSASFVVEHVRCQGHWVGVRWDRTAGGLQVFVDGKVAAQRATMGPLRVHFQ